MSQETHSSSHPSHSTQDSDAELIEQGNCNTPSHVQEVNNSSSSASSAPPRHRAKVNMKLLKRSFAVVESSSPPPENNLSPANSPTTLKCIEIPSVNINNNSETVNKNNGETNRLSEESCNHNSNNQVPNATTKRLSPDLHNPDQSSEVDIRKFLTDILNKSVKDRQFLLKIESDLVNLIKDAIKCSIVFGPMSSYQRLLVHRAAEYFGLDHSVDSKGQLIVINKNKTSNLPEYMFKQLLRDDLRKMLEPRRSILKRESASFEDTTSKSSDMSTAEVLKRSKSFEEREEEYEQARRRIFHQGSINNTSQDSYQKNTVEALVFWSPNDIVEDSQLLHPNVNRNDKRLKKGQSYEIGESVKGNSASPALSKSHSFGGYDQNLPKKEGVSNGSSAVSPLSSGYKSQSMRSDSPSPSATPHPNSQHVESENVEDTEPEKHLLWAVSSIDTVPEGSVLIDPVTGNPYENMDGSLYRFDRKNPPPTWDRNVWTTDSKLKYNPYDINTQPKLKDVQENEGQILPDHAHSDSSHIEPNASGMSLSKTFSQDGSGEDLSEYMMALNMGDQPFMPPPVYYYNPYVHGNSPPRRPPFLPTPPDSPRAPVMYGQPQHLPLPPQSFPSPALRYPPPTPDHTVTECCNFPQASTHSYYPFPQTSHVNTTSYHCNRLNYLPLPGGPRSSIPPVRMPAPSQDAGTWYPPYHFNPPMYDGYHFPHQAGNPRQAPPFGTPMQRMFW